MAEAETNLALNVLPGMSETFEVQGRGELQLGLFLFLEIAHMLKLYDLFCV
jgi:predicted membrane GTPase involved in stress response